MNIAILGSTGYIGKKLTKELSKKHNLLCIKLACENYQSHDNIKYINISDINTIDEDYDMLINLCCRYQRTNVTDYEVFDSNLITPLMVYLKFVELGIKKHITIDTALPKETNLYSLSKKEYANIIKNYSSTKDISIINIVLENYYGADEPKDRFIPSTIDKLKNNFDIQLTTGEQKRDWIHVDDVISSLCRIVDINDFPKYIDFPLGSGECVEIKELITYLKDITNSKSNLLFGAIEKRKNEPNTVADTSLMKKYGLKIRYNWKEGFKTLVE